MALFIRVRSEYYNFSFFPRSVFHWNNLTLETVVCSTLEQFNQAVCKIDLLTIEYHHTFTFKPNLYPH